MYINNRKNVFNKMEEQSFAVFFSGIAPLSTADEQYPFEINRNFFYLTGIDQEDVILVMLKGAGLEKAILFIEPVDPIQALWVGAGLTKDEAIAVSGVSDIYDRKDFEAVLSKYLQDSRAAIFGALKYLYLDLERRDLRHMPTLANQFGSIMKEKYPNLIIGSLHPELGELRSIKQPQEIEAMKQAIEITREGIEALYKAAKAGIKEHQLEAHYNFVLNQHGVKPSFGTIAANGANATILHYRKNNAIIEENNLILFDLGVQKDMYCSDITRTFPVSGRFTDRQKAYYEIVLEANKRSIEFLKPGVTFKEWNDFGKKVLAEGLIKLGKIKDESEVTKYYYHSLGHFLGLDVHDVGNYTKPFEANQVLTVEPGLYIADEGIGIRIEDNVLLTKDGRINLSKSIIKEVKDIESFMKK
jgi:Xaa-Pro aminopeptidase